MPATASVVMARPRAGASGTYDRVFYRAMAVVMGLTVFIGFAPTYYLRFFSGGPTTTFNGRPFTALIHVHGALFTAWALLFIVQTTLVARRRVALHRRLGVAGAVLAALMVIAGTLVVVTIPARAEARPGVDVLAIIAVPFFDMVMFAVFVILALMFRRDKEAHKRLMLLAYVCILVAAVGRLPVTPPGPFVSYGGAFLYVVAGGIYDFVSRRQVHKVYLWGGALFVISVPMRFVVSRTRAWHALAELLAS